MLEASTPTTKIVQSLSSWSIIQDNLLPLVKMSKKQTRAINVMQSSTTTGQTTS